MKWKKIGNILILDNKFTVQSDKQLKELSDKHKVKTVMKVDHIHGTKKGTCYKIIVW